LTLWAELVLAICEAKPVKVVILNPGEEITFEKELAQNVLEIITVFSARLDGSRSRRNQKLLDDGEHALEEASSGFSPTRSRWVLIMSRRRIFAEHRNSPRCR
jgi:superfamily I DNA and/or RNA helicase